MTDIFISYARATVNEAKQVAKSLGALGYVVWRDDQLPPHRAYTDVLAERLKEAKAVVVLWSTHAVRSDWVRSEASKARALGKLVQARLDKSPLPMPFDQIQCVDLAGWSGDVEAPNWKVVLASIAELVSGGRSSGDENTRTAVDAPGLSICVFPFDNMSAEPEQEYFSDGISEDI
ncbi:MAG: TIR domain-containing protein, partial [Caulobacteraceae bacterium]|nr:TIR domain-containing protein [Caulobacteraceae bacterium]